MFEWLRSMLSCPENDQVSEKLQCLINKMNVRIQLLEKQVITLEQLYKKRERKQPMKKESKRE